MPISGIGSPNQPFIPEDKGDVSLSNLAQEYKLSTLPKEYKQEVEEYISLIASGKTDSETEGRIAELKSKLMGANVPDNVKKLFEKMETQASEIRRLLQDIESIEKQLQDPTISPQERKELEKKLDSKADEWDRCQNELKKEKNQFNKL